MRIPEVVGHNIRDRRQALGWTQAELAGHLEGLIGRLWFPQAVSAAEAGQRDFTAEELFCLARALRLPGVDALFAPPAGVTNLDGPAGRLSTKAASDPLDDFEEAMRNLRRIQRALRGES
jgi:transcriptional regulator with XRE-family HTH domain